MPNTAHQIGRAGLVMTFIMGLGLARVAAADTLTVQWDLNTEPEVTGYTLYIGTQSGVYAQTIDVGNASAFVFSSAVAGQRYFFAVAAHAGDVVSPLSLEVSGISNPYPVLLNPGNQSGIVGQSVSVPLAGSDPLGDAITYSTTGLPPGLILSQSLGVIAGTPTTPGTYTVTAGVSDGVLTASQSFTWTIQPVVTQPTNVAPVLTSPGNQTTTVGQAVVLQLQASDSVGQALTFSVSGLPAGLQLTSGTGRIAGTPTTAGTYQVTATVSDGALTAQRSFTWTIQPTQPTNVAPVLTSPGNQTTTVGQAVVLQLQASDSVGQALTFSVSGLPAGLQLTSGTGRIAGTPTTAGTYQVTATVSDGALTAQRSFTWTVAAAAVAVAVDAPPPPTKSEKKAERKASSSNTKGNTAVARTTTSSQTSTPTYSGSASTRTDTTTAAPPPTSVYTGDAAVTRSVSGPEATVYYTGTTAVTRQAQGTAAPPVASSTPATSANPKTVKRSVARSEGDTNATPALDLTVDQGNSAAQNTAVAQSRTTTTAPVSAPTVSIQTPVDHASFAAGSTIMFSAVARDSEDGDMMSGIVWSSSVDGRIGTGGTVFKVLSNGTHTITATVTDSRGTTRTSQVTITVSR